MKTIAYLLSATFLALSSASSSPVIIAIDSEAKIKKIGAEIDHEPVEKVSRSDYLTFRVKWKPTFQTHGIPAGGVLAEMAKYRLDLIVRKNGGSPFPTPTKFQVRYQPDTDGFCHADFSLARSEVPFASLEFRGSWNFEYRMPLEDFVDGFPGDEDPAFFLEPVKAEQNALGQPATRPESK